MPILSAWHDIERTIDGQWTNWQLKFVCQHEGSTTELTHVPCKATRTFGKDDNRHTSTKCLTCCVVSFFNFTCAALINKDVVSFLTCKSYQWNLSNTLFHHPFEVATEEAVDKEDVEGSLVVADKDVALLWIKMFASFNLYREEQHSDSKP